MPILTMPDPPARPARVANTQEPKLVGYQVDDHWFDSFCAAYRAAKEMAWLSLGAITVYRIYEKRNKRGKRECEMRVIACTAPYQQNWLRDGELV
jgi:hypothetical protein